MGENKGKICKVTVLHLTDKMPSGFSLLIALSINVWWKLFVCCSIIFVSFFFFALTNFQDCDSKSVFREIWNSYRYYLIIFDILQILDTILNILCKLTRVVGSQSIPWWLIILNIIACFPIYTLFTAPFESCDIPLVITIFTALRFVKVLDYNFVLLKSYELTSFNIVCNCILLYAMFMYLTCIVYSLTLTYDNFLKFNRQDHPSDFIYFIKSFYKIFFTYAPVEEFGNEYFEMIAYPMLFSIAVGIWALSILNIIELIPAILMSMWIKKSKAHNSWTCYLSIPTTDERIGNNMIEKGKRANLVLNSNKKILKESLFLDMSLESQYTFLMHCDLFKDLDLGFISELATRCIDRRFNEDDIIFDEEELKDCLVYIESGTIGLADPSESLIPTFFLDAGSLIGETTLIRPYHNKFIVTCVSNECLLKILHRKLFLELLPSYPKHFKKISKTINERFVAAHEFVFYAKYLMIGHPLENLWKIPENRIVWIQNALFHMQKAKIAAPRYEEPEYYWDPTEWNYRFHKQMPDTLGRSPLHLTKLVPIRVGDIFCKYTPPIKSDGFFPILYPNSILLQYWENIYVATSCMFCLFWPIRLVYGTFTTIGHLQNLFQFIYTFDLIIFIFSAEKNYQGIVVDTFSSMFASKLFSNEMWVKTLCAAPFEMLLLATEGKKQPSYVKNHIGLFQTVKLLSLCRVHTYYKALKIKSSEHVFIFQLLKNIIALLYFSFATGAAMLMVTCWDTCDRNGWYYFSTQSDTLNKSLKDILLWLTKGMGLVIEVHRTFSSSFVTNQLYNELFKVFFCFLGLVMRYYIFTSTFFSVVAMKTDFYTWQKSKLRITYYLYSYKVKKTTLRRVERYLSFKWICNKMTKSENIGEDQIVRNRLKILSKVSLLKHMSKNQIIDLLDHSKRVFLPPDEVVVYRGQLLNSLLLIEKGNCHAIPKSLSGYDMIRSPGYLIGLPEMLLHKPCFQTFITTSSTILTVIPYDILYKSLKLYPVLLHALTADLESRLDVIKNVPVLQTSDLEYKFEVYFLRHRIPSFIRIVVPALGSAAAREYFGPFKLTAYGDFLKIILFNRVVHANGKFYFLWELSFCILISVFIYFVTIAPLIKLSAPSFFYLLFTAFIVVSLIDIFLKFHLTFYDDEGFLVTHPVRTFQNYIRSDFIFDLIPTFPFVLYSDSEYVYLIHSIKIFRTHKFIRSIYKKNGRISLIVLIIWFGFAVGCLCNVITIKIIKSYCYTGNPSFSQFNAVCTLNTPNDWNISLFLLFMDVQRKLEKILLHFQVTPPDTIWLAIHDLKLKIFVSLFILFTNILIKSFIASDESSDEELLYEHNIRVKNLKRFLIQNKVPKKMYKKCLNFYKMSWKKELNLKPKDIFKPFDDFPLATDILFDIFGETFNFSPIPNASTSFYKNLLNVADIFLCLKGSVILRKGDVENTIYIIHKGYAYEYLDKATISRCITRGDIFGSTSLIEKMSRTVIAQTDMEIMAVNTKFFFDIISKFNILENTFNTYLKTGLPKENAINEKLPEELKRINQENKRRRKVKWIEFLEMLRLVLFIFTFSMRCLTYVVSGFNLKINLIIWCLEIFEIFITLLYYEPWEKMNVHNLNDRIDRKRLKRTNLDLIIDLLATVPFEMFYYLTVGLNINTLLISMFRILQIKFYYDYLARRPYGVSKYAAINFAYDLLMCFILLHVNVSLECFTLRIFSYHDFGTKLNLYLQRIFRLVAFFCMFDVWITNLEITFYYEGFDILIRSITLILCSINHFIIVRAFHKYLKLLLLSPHKYNEIVQSTITSLRNTDSSPLMIDCISDYFAFIWYACQNEDYPILLKNSPDYIKKPILYSMYISTIEEVNMFKDFSHDFVKNICYLLEYNTYSPGDIIVRSGTINETMYFVKKGNVQGVIGGDIVNCDGTISYGEEISEILVPGDAFGIRQGVTKAPFNLNYRSAKLSIILSLKYSDWNHLFQFFPREKELFYNRLTKIK